MASGFAALFEGYDAVVPRFKLVDAAEHKKKTGEKVEDGLEDTPGDSGEHKTTSSSNGSSTGRRRKKRKLDPRENRTIFVGNIPTTSTRKQVKQLFKDFGTVENVRLRSIAVSKDGKLPVKVARRLYKQVVGSSVNAYVVFESQEEAKAALVMNGHLVNGRHIRVDMCMPPKGSKCSRDQKHSVFVGNLPFSADEEELRSAFMDCGEVESVRIVRDPKTGVGKGFGFVTFKQTSGVMFALQRKEAKLEGRVLRVVRAKDNRPEQQKKVSHKRKPKLKRHDGCQGNGITSKAIKSTVKMKFGKSSVSKLKSRKKKIKT